jgi:type II secretion system protein N
MALSLAKLTAKLPHLGPRARTALRIVGYIVLAIMTFVFALQATFPFHRVKGKIEEQLAAKYDVSIKEVERGIMPGRLYLNSVQLRTRQIKPDDVVTTFYIERLQVDVGLFALLTGTASIDIEATIGSGTIEGNISISKSGTEVHVAGSQIPSERLPMREALSNLPMSGRIGFSVDLDLPNAKLKNGKTGPNWPKATGAAMFRCRSGCVIGDGKSKLKLKAKNARSQAFAGEGTDFGTVQVSALLARAEIKKGQLALTTWEFKSPDVELHVELGLTLAQNIEESGTSGCLRFKGTEALRKREPKTFDQIALTGAMRGPDNLDHIRLDGKFKEMRKLAQLCGPGVGAGDIDNPSRNTPARPNLTVQPDEPSRPMGGEGATVQTPTFTPPPITDAGFAHMPADAAVAVPLPHPEGEGSAPPPGVPASGEPAPPAGSAAPVPPSEDRPSRAGDR